MINRYCLDKMKQIWEMQSKFEYYLKVELAVCEAYAQMGEIPLDALEQIKRDAKFDLKRIDEIEAEVHHDVIAFLTCVNEGLGENAKYTIQRYKGLGEMDAEQLWETTMNPQKRVLWQIDLDDAMQADTMFDILMGEKVEPRREFIQEHAQEAELDL